MLGCTLEELGERMSAEEYGCWMALNARDPIDGGWFQAGVIASVMANIHRDKKSQPFSASDFMPKPWEEQKTEELDPMEFVRQTHG